MFATFSSIMSSAIPREVVLDLGRCPEARFATIA